MSCTLPDRIACAVLRVMEAHGDLESVLAQIDTEASGVTPADVLMWFEAHKADDATIPLTDDLVLTIRVEKQSAMSV